MNEQENIELRLLKVEDYPHLKAAMEEAYSNLLEPFWEEEQLKTLIKIFPEGQVVILSGGRLVGSALSIIVEYEKFEDGHTYKEITEDYKFGTHDNSGDTLYGIDIFIKPEYRGMRLGRRLYDYRKELCEKNNLKGIVFGGRIPNYHKYSDDFSPKEYLEKVKSKEIHDPVLDFQLSNDFYPTKIIKDYLEGDDASQDYGIILKWDNIYYEKPTKNITPQKRVVRLGLIQWQMRPYADEQELLRQAEFFIDAVSNYRADFALFPEFFNVPLMAKNNHLPEHEAIRELADHTEDVMKKFSEFSVSYNINIITGSMPKIIDDKLYNVGYLCRRNGTVEQYEKIHVTPDEAKVWGLQGGNKIQIFETDCGRIGVLICYDSEFPELSRLLADQGMEILFVPFLTDTQNGFSRVRHCAQARAIENECYVAIAGSVGNLPNVHNMDIQFAQSMVFTPCDFAFPTTGVKAETTPNTEMILIADVDLDLLKELNEFGSVRNLKDRRKDLYSLNKVL